MRMISKETAIILVEKYLAIQNSRPDIYVFKTPVYTGVIKKIQLFILENYWSKTKKDIDLDYPEWYVKPNKYFESKAIEIIMPEYVEDLGICWSIPYCSKQYYDTRESRYGSIGGGPIFVDKEDGLLYQTGSAPIHWLESFKKYKKGTKDRNEFPNWKPIIIQ